ncbi:MAG: stage III sporulation protein AC [Anaerovoracaceae bacterium]
MDMNVDIVFRIAAIGMIVAILNQVLTRAGREDQAMMTTLAGLLVVLFLVVQMVSELFRTVQTMFYL